MSASVIRAAAMFSFIVAGMNMSRHPNIYNTLAGSAFILLCFNPFLIYDVGFQLSYAAVFSIVFFHPFIYGLLFFKYWVPDQIWILISVSIAAQIGTFPLLLHYFHQFPTWFLLANLMVIPTVTIILYLSCIMFAVAPLFPPIGVMLAHLLDWAGQWMFFSVHFVEKLPYSILDGLYPSDITLFLFVLFAILFTVYIIHKNKPALYCALISVAILFIIKDLSKYNTLLQKEVVVFNLQGKLLVALTSGEETIWITSENNTAFDKLNYYTKPYEGNRGIKKSSIISLTENSPQFINQLNRNRNFINFEGLSLFILNEHNQSIKNSENFPHSDLVILNNINFANQLLSIKNLAGSIIVETGTAAVAEENTDKSLSPSNGIKVLNTSKNGAVILTIKRVSQGNKNIIDCLYSKSL